MKVRVGIIGYGNLGKAIEQEVLKNKKVKLVAIFSRRVVTSAFNTIVEPYDAYKKYIKKIDVMMMCGGSLNDIEYQLPEISKYFCTINSFDTHSKLNCLISEISKINKENKTTSISACGWDPGIFSLIRTLMFAISNEKPISFWGKGISMGHSDAIRNINNVDDALQFTVPNKKAIVKAKKNMLASDVFLHRRECFVVAKENYHNKIEQDIKNIPNYFKGQPTSVTFVSSAQLSKLKSKMSHKGKIICPFKLSSKQKGYFEFSVKMDSNPTFTAKIMMVYIKAVTRFASEKRFDAFLPIDVPISYLFDEKNKQYIINNFC